MIQKKEFMLLFRVNMSQNYSPSEAEKNEQYEQWGKYIGSLAIQEKLVNTHQLGFSGSMIFPDKTSKEELCVSNYTLIGGNMVIKAANLNEAIEIAKGCPILSHGGTVEVRDIIVY